MLLTISVRVPTTEVCQFATLKCDIPLSGNSAAAAYFKLTLTVEPPND